MYDFDEEELARKVLRFLSSEMGENELTFARVKFIAEEMINQANRLPLKVE